MLILEVCNEIVLHTFSPIMLILYSRCSVKNRHVVLLKFSSVVPLVGVREVPMGGGLLPHPLPLSSRPTEAVVPRHQDISFHNEKQVKCSRIPLPSPGTLSCAHRSIEKLLAVYLVQGIKCA